MKNNNNMMVKKEAGANVNLIGNRCYRCNHEWLSYDKNNIPKVCPSCKSPYWDRPRTKPLTKLEKEKKKNGK
jgi:predicted Zn-ribbon and HTH transcriptional regulator